MNNLENPKILEKVNLTQEIMSLITDIALKNEGLIKDFSSLVEGIKHQAYRDAEIVVAKSNPSDGYKPQSSFSVRSEDVGYMDKVQNLVIEKLNDPVYVAHILDNIKKDNTSSVFVPYTGDDKYKGIATLKEHLKTYEDDSKVA